MKSASLSKKMFETADAASSDRKKKIRKILAKDIKATELPYLSKAYQETHVNQRTIFRKIDFSTAKSLVIDHWTLFGAVISWGKA